MASSSAGMRQRCISSPIRCTTAWVSSRGFAATCAATNAPASSAWRSNSIRVAIITWKWGAYLGDEAIQHGTRVKTSSYSRHHVNVMMTKAKICGNYVNSVFAKREAVRGGYDEALMLDTDGYVSEASGENIFMVKNGLIKTTALTSILAGITRASVFTIIADKKMQIAEQRFTRDELYTAQYVFFTGTAAAITPVREIDDRKIGSGKPGPLPKGLQDTFFQA